MVASGKPPFASEAKIRTGRAMETAQVAPLMEAVPSKRYGGTERVVSYLTEQLVELGHKVTLFASGSSVTASGSSVTKATLEPGWPCAMRLDSPTRDYLAPHIVMLEQVARRTEDLLRADRARSAIAARHLRQ
jgi:hypothetical protein